MMKQNFKAELSSLPVIVETIEGVLLKNKTEKRIRIKTVLAAEESPAKLIEHSLPGSMLSLIMGIYAILDMFETASNCLGDVSATVVVARTEGMLDEKVFHA